MRKISIGTGTLCDIIALWDLRSNWGNFYFARYYIWQILASLWSSRAVVLYYALDSKPELWFVCFFVQFWRKEDWGEISICGAAEFMNYIVRPMNKQTLMCFNFAGTNINFDSHFVWIFSFEIRLLLKMDTTSKSFYKTTIEVCCILKSCLLSWHKLKIFVTDDILEGNSFSRCKTDMFLRAAAVTLANVGFDLNHQQRVLTHISHLTNGPWHNGHLMVSG